MQPDAFPFFESDGGLIEPESESTKYNCIAWAAGRTDNPWWPTSGGDAYWPSNAPDQETIEAFVSAFTIIDYRPCESGDAETGYEKIALRLEWQPNSRGPTTARWQMDKQAR